MAESVKLFRSFYRGIRFALPERRAVMSIVALTLLIAAANAAEPLVLKVIFDGLTTLPARSQHPGPDRRGHPDPLQHPALGGAPRHRGRDHVPVGHPRLCRSALRAGAGLERHLSIAEQGVGVAGGDRPHPRNSGVPGRFPGCRGPHLGASEVSFESVSFHYEQSGLPLLCGIDFATRAGKRSPSWDRAAPAMRSSSGRAGTTPRWYTGNTGA